MAELYGRGGKIGDRDSTPPQQILANSKAGLIIEGGVMLSECGIYTTIAHDCPAMHHICLMCLTS